MEALSSVLTHMGYQIGGVARDGLETVDMVRNTTADFLVLDISMPVMDGLEAARIISAEKPLPIIISTGISDENTVEAARQDSGACLSEQTVPQGATARFHRHRPHALGIAAQSGAQTAVAHGIQRRDHPACPRKP